MRKKLVIFDFDGVLVQSLDLWFDITQENNPTITRSEYEAMSYGNYIDAFEQKKLVYSEESLEAYSTSLLEMKIPKEIISFVKSNSNKYLYTIVSSGNEITIKKILEKEGIEHHFEDILGGQTHRNKTVKISGLLEKNQLENKDAVFITDTLGDLLESREAGVKTVGVLWGLHSREVLEKGTPEIIVDSPSFLEEAIHTLLK